jgi:hypothetical protein
MRKLIFFLVVVLLFLAAQTIFFYQGKYQAPPTAPPRLDDIYVTPPPSGVFLEEYQRERGTVVIDRSHSNSFSVEELNVPLMRIMSRGFTVEYLGGNEKAAQSPEGPPRPLAPEEKGPGLEERLRYADALVIILPQDAFTEKEVEIIKEFVGKGGKLLLVADPTRRHQINSIATEFGLIFEDDYLYNLKENDGNFRNIYVHQFQEGEITRNLTRIALYSAGSISSPGGGIAYADANTFSSRITARGGLSPLALSQDGRVLAIFDLTFMAEPYNNVLDNNQLISNLADWLTESQRSFALPDFPYFLKERLRIAYADAKMLDSGLTLKNMLLEQGKSLELGEHQETPANATEDLVFIGLFKDAEKVAEVLERGGISITVTEEEKEAKKEKAGKKVEQPEATPAAAPNGEEQATGEEKPPEAKAEAQEEEKEPPVSIKIKGLGEVFQEEGTAILYLSREKDAHTLLILADSEKTMEVTLEQLESGAFRSWLVNQELAIYHAPKPEKPVRPVRPPANR